MPIANNPFQPPWFNAVPSQDVALDRLHLRQPRPPQPPCSRGHHNLFPIQFLQILHLPLHHPDAPAQLPHQVPGIHIPFPLRPAFHEINISAYSPDKFSIKPRRFPRPLPPNFIRKRLAPGPQHSRSRPTRAPATGQILVIHDGLIATPSQLPCTTQPNQASAHDLDHSL